MVPDNTGPTHKMVLGVIQDDQNGRDIIAAFYANAIARWYQDQTSVDFGRLNRAILRRYKPSGLNYIKRQAWRKFRAKE